MAGAAGVTHAVDLMDKTALRDAATIIVLRDWRRYNTRLRWVSAGRVMPNKYAYSPVARLMLTTGVNDVPDMGLSAECSVPTRWRRCDRELAQKRGRFGTPRALARCTTRLAWVCSAGHRLTNLNCLSRRYAMGNPRRFDARFFMDAAIL
jgi:hypothetical protein